jgi:hypothetical protein
MDAKKIFRDIYRSNLDTVFSNAAEKMTLDLAVKPNAFVL